jgi:hypothetical protein
VAAAQPLKVAVQAHPPNVKRTRSDKFWKKRKHFASSIFLAMMINHL